MICSNAYYIECPYLYEVVYDGTRVSIDSREICYLCSSECYKEEEK